MEKSKVVEHVCNNSDMIARHKKKGTINQSTTMNQVLAFTENIVF